MRYFHALLCLALLSKSIAYTRLSDDALRALPNPGNDFDIREGALLAPILQTRVPGTPGSQAVLQHFVDFFQQSLPKWTLSFQNSSQTTPISGGEKVPFVNLIATRDPPWVNMLGNVGRLALVAHYDSKVTPEGFIGATDSAAPCAMLLHAARGLDEALTRKWDSIVEQNQELDAELDDQKGIQILLLDGEEAFVTWTSTDSLYGARSLAEEWEQSQFGALGDGHALGSIDLFVLLDLLGAKEPKVPSYFKTTHWAYQGMALVEQRLRKLNKFQSAGTQPFLTEGNKAENDRWVGGYIEDDHVPFMARGVEILHIIPSRFPRVWHTMEDDGEHLDIPTVEDWALLTVAFAAEWMDLEGFMDVSPTKRQLGETSKTEL